jgi:hypothetical protein
MTYYYGKIDPKHPNSLRPDLLPDDVRKVWVQFCRYLTKKYRRGVVSLNDHRKWDFARFKEEAEEFESTFPNSST